MFKNTLCFTCLALTLSFPTSPLADGNLPSSTSKSAPSNARSSDCSNLIFALSSAQSEADDAERAVAGLKRADEKAKKPHSQRQ